MWNQFKNSLWTSFLFFVPLLILLIVHHTLNISDKMLGSPVSGKINGMLFNYVIFYIWSLGNVAFLAHTVIIKPIRFLIICFKMLMLPAVHLLFLIYA